MGLDSLDGVSQKTEAERRFETYSDHPLDDQVLEWIDELQERFPEEVRVDFVEVSPEITRFNAKAYWRKRDGKVYQYMRLAEHFIEAEDDWRIKQTILHEMVHLYLYQLGYHDKPESRDSSKMFTWVCGAVGAKINKYHVRGEEWEEIAEPFIDEELKEEMQFNNE